ncbi:YxeA family protein [Paenibacillus daejeonensis]|uniref:YxeA family protein n=1 Tax=Paenibacillus daejeonensis TaxID=135193 RepID=UPI00037696C8|nr:YxeA family protein [Paenibacillus daejeonensis]
MKKRMAVIAMCLLIVSIMSACIDINRMWKSNLYVQITEPVRVEETQVDSGEVHKRYWYEVPAYDEDGEQSLTSFSAIRELREGGYLMLYVKSDGGVTSYDEVQWEAIPQRAREQLQRADNQ